MFRRTGILSFHEVFFHMRAENPMLVAGEASGGVFRPN